MPNWFTDLYKDNSGLDDYDKSVAHMTNGGQGLMNKPPQQIKDSMPHSPIKSIQVHMHDANGVTPTNPIGSGPHSPHSPLKTIKVDFHDVKGMTAPEVKPESNGMEKQGTPQSKLSPLEEALFPHWATANGIDESVHGDPNNHYDFRGMYKQTMGRVHPPGEVANAATQFNQLQTNQPEPIRQLLDMIHSTGTPNPMGQ